MGNIANRLSFFPRFSKETLYDLFESYPYGLVFLDHQHAINYANKQARKIFGYTQKELNGKPFITYVSADNESALSKAIVRLQNSKKPIASTKTIRLDVESKKEGPVPVEVLFNKVQEDAQEMLLCTMTDIRAQVELQQQLYHQAITDSLTDLYNRRYFDEKLTQEFKRSNRYRRPFSTIIIDIDGFKQANDLYGHDFGDELLVQATGLFQQVLREGDTVYRYGGDEFAMILPETPKEGCMEVAERLREVFAKYSTNEKQRIKLSLSIGIASYPEDGIDQKGLIGAADNRMYHSKNQGGNMITAYDSLDHLASDSELVLRALTNLAHLMEKKRGFYSGSTGINHSQSIRSLSIEIAHKLELKPNRLYLLEQAAMLHDIGAISISRSLLVKEDELTERDWDEIKRHTLVGEEIIEMIALHNEQELSELKCIVGQHHEKFNGSGYPRGLKGDEIMIEARILAVTDAFTSMMSPRPYRKAKTRKQAINELKDYSGIHYDGDVVDALLEIEKR